MSLIYNAVIAAYAGAARIVAMRSGKAALMVRGHRDSIARVQAGCPEGGYTLWIHAASLGEFEQGRPLIERLLAADSGCRILLTFFSPSGYTVRHNFHPRVTTAYLPFDTPGNVEAFLDAAKPQMVVFVKYEFWHNYLQTVRRRNIPAYIISAIFRPGQRFFGPLGNRFCSDLRCYNRLYVQDEVSRKLLADAGIHNVTVAGDTRFDRVADIRERPLGNSAPGEFAEGSAPVVVFGSSWPADEDVYIPWLKANEGVKAIVAPHEFDARRLGVLRSRLSRGPGDTMLLSEFEKASVEARSRVSILVIDSFGLLSGLYRLARFAYVGGGFGAGIHNLNEAAVYGIPVIFGPNHRKFNEAAGLMACGGGFSVDSANGFATVASGLADNSSQCARAGKAAGDYIDSNIGGTDIIFADLFPQYIKRNDK